MKKYIVVVYLEAAPQGVSLSSFPAGVFVPIFENKTITFFFKKTHTLHMAQQEGPLGIDNLVDVAVNAYKIGDRIAQAAADGIQYSDAFALVAAFPMIQDIAPKVRPAFSEIRDLTPAEALEFDRRVAAATGLPQDDSIRGKIRQSMSLAARTYDFTVRTYDEGAALVHEWGDLLGIDGLRDRFAD